MAGLTSDQDNGGDADLSPPELGADTKVAAVEFRDVTKIYKDSTVKVLDNVSFNIYAGEFLILVGPSGCGKSTCLRLLAGLETITGGDVLIHGKVVNQLEPKDRNISMVFQSYALFPHLTIAENLGFGLKIKKVPKQVIAQKVQEVANLLDLEEHLAKRPAQLSGGQRQRVALGRAIVRAAKVFLLDEPLSNLDAKLRAKMRTEIKRIQRNFNVATLYVTHDQVEAMTMGDRIAILDAGKIQQVGTPEEVYNTPANQFVAGFIGSPTMNFFPMTTKKEAGSFRLKSADFDYGVPERYQNVLQEDMQVVLGVRPEDIMLESQEGPLALPGVIDIVEPIGAFIILHIRVGNAIIQCQAPNQLFQIDQQVLVKFRWDRIHLFDALTGIAL